LEDALKSENIETISVGVEAIGDLNSGHSIDARQAAEFFEPDFVLSNPEKSRALLERQIGNTLEIEKTSQTQRESGDSGDESSFTVMNAQEFATDISRVSIPDKNHFTCRSSVVSVADESMSVPVLPQA
jgi:hypothetical protein